MNDSSTGEHPQFESELLTAADLEALRKATLRAKASGMARKDFLALCGTKEARDFALYVWKAEG